MDKLLQVNLQKSTQEQITNVNNPIFNKLYQQFELFLQKKYKSQMVFPISSVKRQIQS